MATGCTVPAHDIQKRGTKLKGNRGNVEKKFKKRKQHNIPAADY